MEEISRISKNRTKKYIDVPHFSDIAMYTDPTRVKFFSSNSFNTLTGDSKWSYNTVTRYEIVSLKIRFKSLFKFIGLEFIINASKKLWLISKLWESYLAFIIKGKIIEVILEAKFFLLFFLVLCLHLLQSKFSFVELQFKSSVFSVLFIVVMFLAKMVEQ